MTFLGFLLLVSNFAMAGYYCTQVTHCSDVPNWIFIVVAVNLWLYQVLDNIDGKQARRTGTSSPLGELFDHGCDSLFLLLTGMPWFLGMKMDNWSAFLFLTQGTAVFYGSHWEEFHTHKLIMGVIANPTEAQYGIMSVFLISGFLGPDFWYAPLSTGLSTETIAFFTKLGLNDGFFSQHRYEFIMTNVWFGLVFALGYNAYGAWAAANKNKEGWFAPIRTFAPYGLQVVLLTCWACWSKWGVLDKHTWMFLCMHGILFSYLCDQIMLARICKLPFNAFNPILIIPALGALNVSPLFSTPLVPEQYVMPVLFGALMIIYVYFILSVIYQFSTHLKISVFKIPYPPKVKST